LHWLDVADRVTYKLGLIVYKCLHGRTPDDLSELYTPLAEVAERQHLRSASRQSATATKSVKKLLKINITNGTKAFPVRFKKFSVKGKIRALNYIR